MRHVGYVLFGMALVIASGAAAQGDMVKAHIGHVVTAFQGTPNGQGLLPTALAEAKIAQQHLALAMKSEGDLGQIRVHVGHVLHALDPKVEEKGPGLNYGVRQAAAGVAKHIQLAAKTEGASKNVQTHAVHIAASAENVVKWVDEAVTVAHQVRRPQTAAEAYIDLPRLVAIVERIVNGVDANKDGRVSWEAGEGGLQQAETHAQLLVKGEGL